MNTVGGGRRMSRVMLSAFAWGGSMAAARLVTSFISIKITAIYLGPAGLALVAQLSSFISLLQSMLGQGLTTGIVRLSAEYGDDVPRRRRVYATALRMGVALAGLLALVLFFIGRQSSAWLLTSPQYQWLMAMVGVAVAAAMVTDVLMGTLSVFKEIGLIGMATITSTVLGLAIFAPCSYFWGVRGGLWASLAVLVASALVSVGVVHYRSRGVSLSEFIGPFDRKECWRILSFYPMLMVNGVLPPLALILVRDTLASVLGLEQAGLWQATWRLSDAYQAVIIAATAMYFMPSMGERVNNPPALRRQLLSTLATAVGATAAMAALIYLLREPIVHLVFSARFARVGSLIPLQLLGDVLKMAGWILAMSLVATMRTRAFISMTVLSALLLAGGTRILVPVIGVEGAQWAYIASGLAQVALGLYWLRDVLLLRVPVMPDALPAVRP